MSTNQKSSLKHRFEKFRYQTFKDFDLSQFLTKAGLERKERMDKDQLVRQRRSTPVSGDYYYFDDRSSYPQYEDDLNEILDKYYFHMRK